MADIRIQRRAEQVGVRLVDKYVQRLAQEARDHGKEISPRGPTGRYKRSWRVKRKQAGWWQVYNTDFAKHIVEWGSRNNKPYRPMGQVLTWLRAQGQRLLG